MKLLLICILSVMSLVEYGHSETIQCYECDNCNKLDDTLLKSCPPDTTTPASTTDDPTTSGSTLTPTASSETTLSTTEITDEPTESPEGNSQEAVAMSAPVADPPEAQFHSVLRRSLRELSYKTLISRRSTRDTLSYYCYSIERDDGDKQTTKKGCVEVPDSKKACEVLKDQYGVTDEKCKACSENKCNSSDVLRYSLVTYVIVIFVSLFHV